MKKFTLLLSMLCTMFISGAMAQVNQTVVFDFSNNSWGIPTDDETSYNGSTTEADYTDGTNTIRFVPGEQSSKAGTIFFNTLDGNNNIRLARTNTKLILPAFDFDVEKIEVLLYKGNSSSSNANISIKVNNVKAATKINGTPIIYEIAEDYQAAGNVYELVVGSSSSTSYVFISAIKVYPKAEEGALTVEAPAFDKEAGVYTEAIEVTAHSASADFAGVEGVVYYYTTDGNNPTSEDEESTDGKIAIDESCTLKVVVSFKYEGAIYTSDVSEVEYIISETVTCEKATSFADGRYFIAADGKIATIIKDNVLPTAAAEEATETSITGVGYYAYIFETIPTKINSDSGEEIYEDKLYIKDPEGKYLRFDAGGASKNPKLVTMSTYHQGDVEVVVEDGVAKITKNGYYLVYDNVNNAFTITDNTEGATFPILYLIEKFDQNDSVEDIEIENGKQAIYDLSGRRVEAITEAGIYIVDGGKVLVK